MTAMDSTEYLRERVRDIGERYRRDFPQWTNRDWVCVSCLISDVADIARFNADDIQLRAENARLRTRNAELDDALRFLTGPDGVL